MRLFAPLVVVLLIVSGAGIVAFQFHGWHPTPGTTASAHSGVLALPSAAPTWTQIFPLVSPTNRDQAMMDYDPILKEVILFGGYSALLGGPLNDTWTYHAGVWTQILGNTTTIPPARWGAGFVYDPQFHGIVMFGGRSLSAFFNDTWLFTGGGWRLMKSPHAPSERSEPAMAFDAKDKFMFLFGGGIGNLPAGSGSAWTFSGDTWKLTPLGWSNITKRVTGSASGAPTHRFSMVASWDPIQRKVVLFGGYSKQAFPPFVAEQAFTYTFANRTYANLTTVVNPGGEYAPEMTWDVHLREAILFGENTSSTYDPTWAFHAGRLHWTNASSAVSPPGGRGNVAICWDDSDAYVLLFGGDGGLAYTNDTWAFR